jgi:4-hydroxy-tetrahydrodipicolinate reductase
MSTKVIRLLVHGAAGRMGARIVALAAEDARVIVARAIDLDTPADQRPARGEAIDVVIDFSSDAGAQLAAGLALAHRAALLVGTTGLSPATQAALRRAAESVPVMIAANTSRGVAALAHLAALAARLLGRDFDIDLVETHHAMKKDSPSGTALRLADSLAQGAGAPLPAQRIHAIRAGDVIGEHAIVFSGPGERLTLTHTATSRDLFALGALRAAAWLAGRPPGLYSIEQSLGLD